MTIMVWYSIVVLQMQELMVLVNEVIVVASFVSKGTRTVQHQAILLLRNNKKNRLAAGFHEGQALCNGNIGEVIQTVYGGPEAYGGLVAATATLLTFGLPFILREQQETITHNTHVFFFLLLAIFSGKLVAKYVGSKSRGDSFLPAIRRTNHHIILLF